MDKKQCKTCQYFRQHFGMDQRKIFRIYCGHCVFAGSKRKQPDAIACDHYQPGSVPEDAFATKEYLSKELLQYLLNLELMPQIEDRG